MVPELNFFLELHSFLSQRELASLLPDESLRMNYHTWRGDDGGPVPELKLFAGVDVPNTILQLTFHQY